MENIEYVAKNVVCFDKKIYDLDAIFRAIVDTKILRGVKIEEDCINYIALFCEDINSNEKQMFISNVNVQMVKIKLENRFDNIRRIIVERAMSANKVS